MTASCRCVALRSGRRASTLPAVFLIAGMLSVQAADNLILCHERPLDQRYWTWREIDGRRCWFQGPRNTPKVMLFWNDATHHHKNDLVPDPVPVVVGEFDQRWNELMIDLGVAPWEGLRKER